jgi:hypothetical protein
MLLAIAVASEVKAFRSLKAPDRKHSFRFSVFSLQVLMILMSSTKRHKTSKGTTPEATGWDTFKQ